MSKFTRYRINTAKEESIPALKQAEQLFGFAPNLIAALAESPTTILKQQKTPNHQVSRSSGKASDNQDTRYDYLMLLTNDWIATQKHSNDFIRSIN